MTTIVSDTSPLVAFAFLGLQDLLPQILGDISIPSAVAIELGQSRFGFAGIQALSLPGVKIRDPLNRRLVQTLLSKVDQGEAEALALAVEMNASLIVIDEADGRRTALELGLVVTGTIGLLLRAKQREDVPAIKPLLDRLRTELRFFLSDTVYEHALATAGE